MAKKRRKKQSVYTKTRNQILEYIRRQKKLGVQVTLDFPLATEKQLKQRGIKGAKLTAETKKLKALKEQLKYKEAVNVETGEIATPKQFEKQRREERKQQKKDFIPDDGDVVFDNVFEQYIKRLSEPVPRYNVYGKNRNEEAYLESLHQRTTLYSFAMDLANKYGKKVIGERIMAHPEIEGLLNYVLYGSNASAIQSASHEIAAALSNGQLSLQQLKDLADESELYEDWTEPL